MLGFLKRARAGLRVKNYDPVPTVIVRWNADRVLAVRERENITCADIWLAYRVQQLSRSIFGTDSRFVTVPNVHTGELFAVKYFNPFSISLAWLKLKRR